MNTSSSQKNQSKYALAAFLAVVIYVIIYKYTLNQLNYDGINDLREHTWHARDIYLNTLRTSWLERPYLFWHLCVKGFIKFFEMPVNEASACTHACFAAINYFVTFYILDKLAFRYNGRDSGIVAASVSGILSLVMPLYIHWYNSYHYEGQFSINPFFNPTHMAVKPIGLLAFALAVDLILHYKDQPAIFFSSLKSGKAKYISFSLILLLSTFTKPTFMYMLLPAGVVYLLIELAISLYRKDGTVSKVWSFMWRIACACIPSLVYLVLEYSAFYFWGGTNSDAEIAIYPFLHAWHLFSPNVPKSIVLAMSFPLWMLITSPKYFIQTVEGRLGLLGYIVGTLEFSFFVETGDKLAHLNFSWPMMSGMLLFWVVAAARLVTLTGSDQNSKRNTIIVIVGWIQLTLHLFSGLYNINPYQYII